MWQNFFSSSLTRRHNRMTICPLQAFQAKSNIWGQSPEPTVGECPHSPHLVKLLWVNTSFFYMIFSKLVYKCVYCRWMYANSTKLTKVCLNEGLLWRRSALSKVCFDKGPLWRRSASTKVRFDEGPLRWRSASMKVCLDEGLLRQWSSLMKVHFDKGPLWQRSALTKVRFDKGLLWRRSALTKVCLTLLTCSPKRRCTQVCCGLTHKY